MWVILSPISCFTLIILLTVTLTLTSDVDSEIPDQEKMKKELVQLPKDAALAKQLLGGDRDSPAVRGLTCGGELQGQTYLTHGDSMRLHFTSDKYLADTGVTAVINFVNKKECCQDPPSNVCVKQGSEKDVLYSHACTNNPCLNAGTCIENNGTRTCHCAPGFTGSDCSQYIGPEDVLSFEKVPTSGKHQKGATVFEECKLGTKEAVEYSWFFKDEKLPMFTDYNNFGYLMQGALPGSVLEINGFTEQHEGVYTCMATTQSGKQAKSICVLSMKEECKIDKMKGPGNVTKKLGESVTLGCSTDPPGQSVIWKKNGWNIDFQSQPRFQVLLTGLLHITDLHLADRGQYTCSVVDDGGCVSERTGALSVLNVIKHNKYCGQTIYGVDMIEAKISKGKNVKPKSHPWHVIFISEYKDMGDRPFCGGSLISRNFALTSASCIADYERSFRKDFISNARLILGSTDCTGKSAEVIRRPKNIILHEDFRKAWRYSNDIALIELDTPVQYPDDKSIVPICIRDQTFNDKAFFRDRRKIGTVYGTAAGCGSNYMSIYRNPGILKEVELPYLDDDECVESALDEGIPLNVTNLFFCAGRKIARVGAVCSGDTGGALIMADETRWIQTGIVSFGKKCDRGHPDFFTNVGVFYDWVDWNTNFSKEEVVLKK